MPPLKRHPALVHLSQEHHHSLALCLRILRAPQLNHQADIERHQTDLLAHFHAEETQFAPYWAQIAPELKQRFESDHAQLRHLLSHPDFQQEAWNIRFAETLRQHARFEERELFPAVQALLPLPDPEPEPESEPTSSESSAS